MNTNDDFIMKVTISLGDADIPIFFQRLCRLTAYPFLGTIGFKTDFKREIELYGRTKKIQGIILPGRVTFEITEIAGKSVEHTQYTLRVNAEMRTQFAHLRDSIQRGNSYTVLNKTEWDIELLDFLDDYCP